MTNSEIMIFCASVNPLVNPRLPPRKPVCTAILRTKSMAVVRAFFSAFPLS